MILGMPTIKDWAHHFMDLNLTNEGRNIRNSSLNVMLVLYRNYMHGYFRKLSFCLSVSMCLFVLSSTKFSRFEKGG
jgi:hypothetical protein